MSIKRRQPKEIVNDIMMKVWHRRADLNSISNLETYLFVAVRNHSLTTWRNIHLIHAFNRTRNRWVSSPCRRRVNSYFRLTCIDERT